MAKNEVANIGSQKINNFWLMAGLLVILLATSMSRDIFRPFYGLHSWAEAHSNWAARVHAKYGLGYTKGFSTRVVGDNLPEKPYRYMDHPQAEPLISAVFFKLFGYEEWVLRTVNIVTTSITLIILILITRGLCDDKTALLTGTIFCLFPLMAYFGVHQWLYVFAVGAIYNYLILTDEIQKPYFSQKTYRILLAVCLAMSIQLSWEGFFFAFGIGFYYVASIIFRKKHIDWNLLCILFFAPVISLLIVFLIMAAGIEWDMQRIVDLFMWRAGTGEMLEHNWGAWFSKLWEFMVLDYTFPVMIIVILYITIGQLFVFMETKPAGNNKIRARQFPLLLLFLLIPTLQIFLLKGCLWRHQTWLRPFSLFISIAGAQGILLAGDMFTKFSKKISSYIQILLVLVCLISSIKGSNYFYNIRWQAEPKIEMLKKLNLLIPPKESLLSFEDFIVNQNEAKGAFYRPEVAWYLDRDIVMASTLEEIQEKAMTGKYPYYLMPLSDFDRQTTAYLNNLSTQLGKIYNYEYIHGVKGETTKDGKFLKAGMSNYLLFDLSKKK